MTYKTKLSNADYAEFHKVMSSINIILIATMLRFNIPNCAEIVHHYEGQEYHVKITRKDV